MKHGYATLVFLLLLPALRAQTTYAVLVGVDAYQLDPAHNNLHFSDDDARQFYQFLRSPAGGNVPAPNLVLLTGSRATHANITQAMALFAQARPDDRVIFYFSGHGAPGYFLPHDVGIRKAGLSHEAVKAAFRASRAHTKLCLADACFSGSIRTKSTLPPPETEPLKKAVNIVVFMASRPDEPSVEMGQLKQGVFTYFLLKGLAGGADSDRDRRVSAYELYAYTRRNVQQFTKGRQTPIAYGNFPKELTLARISRSSTPTP